MARYAHLTQMHVRQAALTLDKQLPIGIPAPTVTVPTTETALVPADATSPLSTSEQTPANLQ